MAPALVLVSLSCSDFLFRNLESLTSSTPTPFVPPKQVISRKLRPGPAQHAGVGYGDSVALVCFLWWVILLITYLFNQHTDAQASGILFGVFDSHVHPPNCPQNQT